MEVSSKLSKIFNDKIQGATLSLFHFLAYVEVLLTSLKDRLACGQSSRNVHIFEGG